MVHVFEGSSCICCQQLHVLIKDRVRPRGLYHAYDVVSRCKAVQKRNNIKLPKQQASVDWAGMLV